MHRPSISSLSCSSSGASQSFRVMSSQLVLPLALWICVSLSVRYGYYGNYSLVLGPNSSRLMVTTSSVFVEQVQVRSNNKNEFFLYGFSEKPELSLETNWSASKHMLVEPYARQGFSLWLNKGSRTRITWEVQQSNLSNMLVVFIKGERNFDTAMKYPSSSTALGLMNVAEGNGEAEYTVEEEDSYYIGVVNLNQRGVVMAIKVDLSSTKYDTTKAKSQCSATQGFCRLNLLFPSNQYVVLATPNNGDVGIWDVEVSLVARFVAYVVILGVVVLIICLIFKYLGACGIETAAEAAAPVADATETETDPLIPTKETPCLYGAVEEDSEEEGLYGTSNDLYDGKLCVICYDQERNCFFVPCGHCATCYACAQRIMEEDVKACPICRRVIHRVRRLFNV
ncbi:hypothetical protein MRB53_012656 [Persea americana]|uniref:Uncharacterized protein n=1 Tax=Persea americana TaxID=3435 RepID=A0ACC2LYG4_PERAE|nr:hypothetical protein MRB53_012656 [Persea americana]|eukprot:TRINITY_DN6364_c0_g1_i5.p1 TRINITY_DN6364_c0_g1~~TRINITY_DN6364_c0_g1_i5.p1  ORF type:complete len:396 (-),score=65.87 TRINITY_DN6364_c0_g1_i5:413-1600(-)